MELSHKNKLDPLPYWLREPLITGKNDFPSDGEILVIGSGLAGVSSCYWLQQNGFKNISLVDFEADKAASFRNCGHILPGTVESLSALATLHGAQVACDIWRFSEELCQNVEETAKKLAINFDYQRRGYLVVAIDEAEDQEIQQAVTLMQQNGFDSRYLTSSEIKKHGFKNVYGGRLDPKAADAHPVKFRNALIKSAVENGLNYIRPTEVLEVEEEAGRVRVQAADGRSANFEAAVIASNAYSPLLSQYFNKHRLVEPFRGQIISSAPLRKPTAWQGPHSFDHGYEYGLYTKDNRLLLGGWRQHSSDGERGSYDLTINEKIETGLKKFAKHHYEIDEEIHWEQSWSGIMASSRTGLPLIGPTDSPLIYTICGFTGHGFSWAHGSAKLLADMMAGKDLPTVAHMFDPRPRV